jgi:hypothetical protein
MRTSQWLLMCLTMGVVQGCLATQPQQAVSTRTPTVTDDGRFWIFSHTHLNQWKPANWMPAEAARMVTFNDKWADASASGGHAIRVRIEKWAAPYWAGMAWAVNHPASPDTAYWGDVPAPGWNLTGATAVRFRARAPRPCRVQFKAAIIVTDEEHPHGDSAAAPAETAWLDLTPEWRDYRIDLAGTDLRRVVTAFAFVAARDRQTDPNAPIEFFLDDIYWEFGEPAAAPVAIEKVPEGYRFWVYRDKHKNGWTPANWMPEQAPEMIKKFAHDSTDNPYEGENCLHVRIDRFVAPYWCGVAWALEDPARPQEAYWGETPLPAWDLRGARKVVFWARAPRPCRVQFKVATFGDKRYGDSARLPAQSRFVELTPEWKRYEIDVSRLDLRRVVSGFCFVTNRDAQRNPNEPIEFFLDSIYWDMDAEPKKTEG